MWKMDPNEILLNRGGGGGTTNGKTGEGFIDRSKVRILLCDNDTKSSQEAFNLLCKCSYQVTSVRSPRQVIDALNAEGPEIDIILSEVDLPMAKGFRLLKYIMRDKDLRRIPVIMMSAQDEVALVVKCLRLGAADYLVKPLRTNELLNLWTHMWRRRRVLGLAEKNIMNCEFDLLPSDHSDANTNSTTLFSDDTDEKSLKTSNPEVSVAIPREDKSTVNLADGLVNTPLINLSNDRPNIPEISEQQRGKSMFGPKKSELRIGQSSAFFTYVKSSVLRSDETAPSLLENNITVENVVRNTQGHDYTPAEENIQNNTMSPEYSQQSSAKISTREAHTQHSETNNHRPDVSRYSNPYSAYPYYLPGPMSHVMMSSPSSIHQHNMNSTSPYPHHHMTGMTSFPYYPVNVCLPGQIPPGIHPWTSYGSSSNNNVKVHKLDRREAALLKFRQKRKERCFDKKVRYVNRKKLAERRPRVKGQFVRKINGINVDLNGQPASTDFDDEDDEEEEEEEDQDQENEIFFS